MDGQFKQQFSPSWDSYYGVNLNNNSDQLFARRYKWDDIE